MVPEYDISYALHLLMRKYASDCIHQQDRLGAGAGHARSFP